MHQVTYSISDLEKTLQLSHSKLYEEIQAKRLRTYKIGRRRYVSHDALIDYIKAREAESNS